MKSIKHIYVVIHVTESRWKGFSGGKDFVQKKYIKIEDKAFLSYESATKHADDIIDSCSLDPKDIIIEKISFGEL